MPPAGRAAALAIFNLSLPKEPSTSRTSHGGESGAPKWEEVFTDIALGPPSQSSRASKRSRHDGSQSANVVTRSKRPKMGSAAVPVQSGGLHAARTDSYVKEESIDDDVILVPTFDVHEEATDEQISDALAGLKNRGAKIKKNSIMPDRILYNRLKTIGFELYPVEDSVNKHFLFSRYFFSQRFGGSFVKTFPKPSAKMLERHGIDDLGFFSLLYNPHAPQVPGAPGLIYSCQDTVGELQSRRMFVRLDDEQWLYYVGRHTFTAAPSLTVAEYELTSPKVRSTWSKRMQQAPIWAHEVLARIYLRTTKGGLEPSEEEVETLLSKDSDIITRRTITEAQITAAYLCGQERFGVWAMKCIDYDAEWIAKLVEDFPVWKKEFNLAKRSKTVGTKSSGGSRTGDKTKKRGSLKQKA